MRRVGERRLPANIAIWIGLAALYFFCGRLGLRFASVHPSATAVWVDSGLSLTAVLLLGRSAWPGIFLGAFLVNMTTAGSWLTCLGIATGNTLEAITGAWLVTRFAQGRQAFQAPQSVFQFAALAGAVSTMVAATLGVTSLAATGYAAWADFGPIWLTWWLGDGMGDLLVAPFLLLWAGEWRVRWSARQSLEAGFLFLSLAAVSVAVFAGLLPPAARNYSLEVICIPVLLWTAFRFGARETATATLGLAGVAIWGTLRGMGPFTQASPNTSLLLLQIFLGVVAVMSIAVAATVWEGKRLEARLRRSERQLSRHAAEMEQFAYAANHDLREPLRTISLYAQLLARRCAGQLGKDAEEYIDRIVTGVARMETLMRGVFEYSLQMHAEPAPTREVAMSDVVDTVQKNLESLIQESGARVVCGDLPVLEGNREQLVSLCQNLIANAIQYRSSEAPVVTITAGQKDHEWVLSVRDNGMGIEPQYHEHIFSMFKRVHRSRQDGSGLGLAISRRIVERHGGRIWVESEAGQGATFCFTIPLSGRNGHAPGAVPGGKD